MQSMQQLLFEIHFQKLEVYEPSQKLKARIKFKNIMKVMHGSIWIITS
jgi:hypothetical protein